MSTAPTARRGLGKFLWRPSAAMVEAAKLSEYVRSLMRAPADRVAAGTRSRTSTRAARFNFVIGLEAATDDAALTTYFRVWSAAMEACRALGLSITHHHGIGAARDSWISAARQSSDELFRRLVSGADPAAVFGAVHVPAGRSRSRPASPGTMATVSRRDRSAGIAATPPSPRRCYRTKDDELTELHRPDPAAQARERERLATTRVRGDAADGRGRHRDLMEHREPRSWRPCKQAFGTHTEQPVF